MIKKTLFLLFALLPVFEITGFVVLGDELGIFNTLLICAGTAVSGILVMKLVAVDVLETMRSAASQHDQSHNMAQRGLIAAALLWPAGICLVIPGYITDISGLLLTLPPVRDYLAGRILSRFRSTNTAEKPNDVIDGDYREL